MCKLNFESQSKNAIRSRSFGFPSTSFYKRLAMLAGIPCASLLGGCISELEMMTRDSGEVTVACNNESTVFMVSVNNDNDRDGNAEPNDKRRPRLDRNENNLKPFRFTAQPNATKVEILEPEDIDSHASVEGRRVRSWAEGTTPGRPDTYPRFTFGTFTPPVTLYLEGFARSRKEEDTVVKYIYKNDNNDIVCASEFHGTIVEVDGTLGVDSRSGQFRRNRKILIGGAGQGNIRLRPAIQPVINWTDENGGTLIPADALQNDYTAPMTSTPDTQRDQRQIRVTLAHAGQTIEAHRPFNITKPTRVTPDRNRPFRRQTRILDANDGRFDLFQNWRITYTIKDQFGDDIDESGYGGRMPQIRENIGTAMTSVIPNVQDWINNGLQWTSSWRDKPEGEFTDGLNAFSIPKDRIRIPNVNALGQVLQTFQFHTELQRGTDQNPTGVMMRADHHIWEVSVNGDSPVNVTDNSFMVRVIHKQGRPVAAGGLGVEIQLESVYTIGSPPL